MTAISQHVRGLKYSNPLGVYFINHKTGNQTTYINNLMQTISDDGGGELKLDLGVWTANLEVPNNITLSGFGLGLTEINPTTTTGVQKVIKNKTQTGAGNENIVLKDLVIDAKRTTGASGGGGNVDFQIIKNLRLINITSKNPHSHCFEIGHFEDVYAENCIGRFETSYTADDCFSISDYFQIAGARRSKGGLFVNCKAYGFPTAANTSGFEVDDAPQDVTFIACKSYGVYGGFTVHVHTGTASPTDIMFTNCVSDGCERGFSCYQLDTIDNIKNIKFTDCVAKNGTPTSRGFFIDDIGTPTHKLGKVELNGCSAEGSYQGLINHGENTRIMGCDFENNTVPYTVTFNINQIAGLNRPAYTTL